MYKRRRQTMVILMSSIAPYLISTSGLRLMRHLTPEIYLIWGVCNELPRYDIPTENTFRQSG